MRWERGPSQGEWLLLSQHDRLIGKVSEYGDEFRCEVNDDDGHHATRDYIADVHKAKEFTMMLARARDLDAPTDIEKLQAVCASDDDDRPDIVGLLLAGDWTVGTNGRALLALRRHVDEATEPLGKMGESLVRIIGESGACLANGVDVEVAKLRAWVGDETGDPACEDCAGSGWYTCDNDKCGYEGKCGGCGGTGRTGAVVTWRGKGWVVSLLRPVIAAMPGPMVTVAVTDWGALVLRSGDWFGLGGIRTLGDADGLRELEQ